MRTRKQPEKPSRRRFSAPEKPSPPKAKNSCRTIAVDFDGVIAEYDGWKGKGVLGLPRKDVVEALHELRAEGWKVVIHTTRGEREVRPYLVRHGIPHDE